MKLLKFADGATVIGVTLDSDESAYRWEVDQLVSWTNRTPPSPPLTIFNTVLHRHCSEGGLVIWLINRTEPVQRATIRPAERIIRADLLSVQFLYRSKVRKRANISSDPTHPGHKLLGIVPFGRRYRDRVSL